MRWVRTRCLVDGELDAVHLQDSFSGASARLTPAELRAFRDYPVYWVGESFEGLDLNVIQRDQSTTRLPGTPAIGTDMMSVIYGSCPSSPCPRPVQVQTWRACAAPQGVGVTPLAGRTQRRGVPSGYRGGGLVLFTGDVAVTIWAEKELEARTVEALVRANGADDRTGADEGLPPPSPSNPVDEAVPCLPK